VCVCESKIAQIGVLRQQMNFFTLIFQPCQQANLGDALRRR